ncbi:MAG: class I SAM-dependent methyltransferase [Siphonobacter sp.]
MKVETLTNCPVCKGTHFSSYLVCKDYTVSQEMFSLVKCTSCGFIFTNPRPTETEIGSYYQSNEYISHSNTKQGLIAQVYHTVRKITLKSKLKLINRLHPTKGTLLDIGCGTGMFLSVCKENGWNVSGVEPDSGARKLAEDTTKSHIESSILEYFQNQKFSIVTMWHVLEHVHRLEETIDWLYNRIDTNGHLIIAVPNLESKDAQVYQQYWAAYDVPRHLYHFSQVTISELFLQKGFVLSETLPMPFDSFYVSMLSTKYRDGKTNYIEAIQQGLASNIWAKQNHKNYSSLIYVFKKR